MQWPLVQNMHLILQRQNLHLSVYFHPTNAATESSIDPPSRHLVREGFQGDGVHGRIRAAPQREHADTSFVLRDFLGQSTLV